MLPNTFILFRTQTIVTKFKMCVQMEAASKVKKSVKPPIISVAMNETFDPYDVTK